MGTSLEGAVVVGEGRRGVVGTGGQVADQWDAAAVVMDAGGTHML